ncbi:hypothetical protein Tco_0439640, partial [Tanacetum coccineum]
AEDIVPLMPAMLAGAAMDQGNTSGSAEASIQLKELMVLVPNLVTRVTSLEKELKETKQTLGNVVLKLLKKVKSLEIALKRKSKKGRHKKKMILEAKLEANTEVVKSLQRECISNDDFVKRSKPMTQAQQREYMSTFIKNQSSWKLSQLKKLSFEELKTKFEKLMKSIESFVPMETEARVKRHGLQLEQETSKKQKIDIEDDSITKGKDKVVKEEEAEVPVKKTGKRRKQKARKGINIAKTAQDEFNNEREAFVKDKVKDASSESEIGVDAIPTATKPPTIVNWKIISQSSQKAAYQIIRIDGSDKIYMSFGAILKDFSRDDLIELYRLVIKKYGANRPEEMYDRVLWGDLKTMFDPPLSDDAIWSLPLQQKIINWRYYPTCAVHCLTLDASTIYMLADRKYPLSKDACQVMLKMKLLDGTMDEVCYQLLKMIEKQAGLRL